MIHGTKPIRLHIATYNVHKCRGMDGRTRPSRIASVLKGLRADVVALQEVIGAGPGGRGQEEDIGARLNMGSVLASARILRGHLYGNALLSRFPIDQHITYDLSQHGYEPRLCQRVDLLMGKHPIHIYNVHLGTSRAERTRQAAQLIRILEDPKVPGPQNRNGGFQRVAPGASFEASIREAGQPGFGSISPMAPDVPWVLSGFSFGPYLLPGFGGNYQSGSPTEMVMPGGF